MAIYVVAPDDYAGWNPTGRTFAIAGIAAGSVGLLCWLSLHGFLGHLPGHFRDGAAADQIFLAGFVWIGAGGFCLMAMVAFGCILLTLRSRGTLSVTHEGVLRTVGSRVHSLAWSEIQGFVPMPYGGVTLVSGCGKPDILIPRFLDDYRACIAEIKDYGIRALPPSSLRNKQKTTWKAVMRNSSGCFFYLLAINAHHSQRVRIASLCAAIAFLSLMVREEWSKPDQNAFRWISPILVLALVLYALRQMTF